jgi:hypothetical protein
LDDQVYRTATELEGVEAIRLSDVEAYDQGYYSCKGNRLSKEYYATMSPIMPLYIFHKYPEVDLLFYTDADIAFWSDPQEMFGIMGDKSLMVVDHGFEPPRSNVRFNVGILGYRNDEHCKEFLGWWREQCIRWCKWVTLPDGRCADQGYLNILHNEPEKFKNHLSCPHPGVNMGPWNIGKYKITREGNRPLVNGHYNLICYHYHEFRMIGTDSYYPTGWEHSASDRQIVYEPYFRLLQQFIKGKLL